MSQTQLKPVAAESNQTSDILAMPLVKNLATKFAIEPARMLQTLKATVFRIKSKGDKPAPEISNEQLIMLMAVASKYDLDPFTKEIYAFPSDGGITAIVPIDGWSKIINSHPMLDGIEFEYAPEREVLDEQDRLVATVCDWIECIITRKDRSKPIKVREYLSECTRGSDPWKQMPRRMLRHKALMQCGRIAFGLGGITDEDEAGDIRTIPATVTDGPLPEIPEGRIKKVRETLDRNAAINKAVMDKDLPGEPESNTPSNSLTNRETAEKVAREVSPNAHAAKKPEPILSADELTEAPAWVTGRLGEIDNSPKSNLTESIGNKIMTEFRSPETPDPDRIKWYPILFRAWAHKMGMQTMTADKPRMEKRFEGWRQYLGSVYNPVVEAFQQGYAATHS